MQASIFTIGRTARHPIAAIGRKRHCLVIAAIVRQDRTRFAAALQRSQGCTR
jgi:hypothetical protein